MGEGFNNFEQGLLIACALFSTFSLMWLAIVLSSAALRTINTNHQLERIADALQQRKHSNVSTTEDK